MSNINNHKNSNLWAILFLLFVLVIMSSIFLSPHLMGSSAIKPKQIHQTVWRSQAESLRCILNICTGTDAKWEKKYTYTHAATKLNIPFLVHGCRCNSFLVAFFGRYAKEVEFLEHFVSVHLMITICIITWALWFECSHLNDV